MARPHLHRQLPPLWFEISSQTFQCLSGAVVMDLQIKEDLILNPLFGWFSNFRPPASSMWQQNLEIFNNTCKDLGVPLAQEKVVGPTTCLNFLVITLDSERIEIRLPEDKFKRIRAEVSSWLQKKSATKRQILSLVGILQHATKVVRPGRTFVARMYSTAAKVKNWHFTQDWLRNLSWIYTGGIIS